MNPDICEREVETNAGTPEVELKPKEFKFKIGADPEFTLTIQHNRASAKNVLEKMLDNKKEFDFNSYSNGFDLDEAGNVGWDGASETGEFRPKAESNPHETVENIGKLLKTMYKYVNQYDITTLSEFASIGGHVHLEIPEKWNRRSSNEWDKMQNILASFYTPILATENTLNISSRNITGYGRADEYHVEHKFDRENGEPGKTFEFRTPSAEWLTTPKIAKSVLSYLAVVYNEILTNPKKVNECKDIIFKTPEERKAVYSLIVNKYSPILKTTINNIHKKIKTFSKYGEFKEDIDYIFDTNRVIKDKIKVKYNMVKGWEIEEVHKINKKDVLSTKKEKSIIENTDLDEALNSTQVYFNHDTNVTEFAQSLAAKSVGLKWKLKNIYFLYGLKKGVKDFIITPLKQTNGNLEIIEGASQIKTRGDYNAVTSTIEKMASKAFDIIGSGIVSASYVDYVTGKKHSMVENVIMVGIPYSERISKKTRGFINKIWDIEKGTKKSSSISHKDTMVLSSDGGEIEKAYSKKEGFSETSFLTDNNMRLSQSGQSMRNAQEQLIYNGLITNSN